MLIHLLFHPTAYLARQLDPNRDVWALVDTAGNTVDVVDGEGLDRILANEAATSLI